MKFGRVFAFKHQPAPRRQRIMIPSRCAEIIGMRSGRCQRKGIERVNNPHRISQPIGVVPDLLLILARKEEQYTTFRQWSAKRNVRTIDLGEKVKRITMAVARPLIMVRKAR